jgi:hypothetical protein
MGEGEDAGGLLSDNWWLSPFKCVNEGKEIISYDKMLPYASVAVEYCERPGSLGVVHSPAVGR